MGGIFIMRLRKTGDFSRTLIFQFRSSFIHTIPNELMRVGRCRLPTLNKDSNAFKYYGEMTDEKCATV